MVESKIYWRTGLTLMQMAYCCYSFCHFWFKTNIRLIYNIFLNFLRNIDHNVELYTNLSRQRLEFSSSCMNNAVKDETISLIGLFNIVSLLVTFHLAYRVHLSVQLFAEKKIHALTSKFPSTS